MYSRVHCLVRPVGAVYWERASLDSHVTVSRRWKGRERWEGRERGRRRRKEKKRRGGGGGEEGQEEEKKDRREGGRDRGGRKGERECHK